MHECSANSLTTSLEMQKILTGFRAEGIVFYMYLFIVFTSYIYGLASTQKVKAIIICTSW